MADRRRVDDLTIEELEQVLAIKKREARQERLRRERKRGRRLPTAPDPVEEDPLPIGSTPVIRPRPWKKRLADGLLLLVEIALVFALLYIGLTSFGLMQRLNQEAASAFQGNFTVPTPAPTAFISAVVLPGGHTPPDAQGNSEFNLAEIPENLRPLIQTSLPAVAIPTPSPEQARALTINKIGLNAVPIVQGDTWEQLKLGVGQHIGSANPGQPGNIVLSAHNDIYGELFRNLDQLTPGDTFTIYTATSQFTYRVTGSTVVDPIEGLYVLQQTMQPTATLISCYPYLVNTHRIVVFAELVTSGGN